jgi:hypothetical protein
MPFAADAIFTIFFAADASFRHYFRCRATTPARFSPLRFLLTRYFSPLLCSRAMPPYAAFAFCCHFAYADAATPHYAPAMPLSLMPPLLPPLPRLFAIFAELFTFCRHYAIISPAAFTPLHFRLLRRFRADASAAIFADA